MSCRPCFHSDSIKVNVCVEYCLASRNAKCTVVQSKEIDKIYSKKKWMNALFAHNTSNAMNRQTLLTSRNVNGKKCSQKVMFMILRNVSGNNVNLLLKMSMLLTNLWRILQKHDYWFFKAQIRWLWLGRYVICA